MRFFCLKIKQSENYKIEKKEDVGEIKLIIKKASVVDSGTYTCIAENSEGKKEAAVITLIKCNTHVNLN